MAFQGGVHINGAGAFTEEAASAISVQIAAQINAWEAQFMNLERRTLLDTIGPLGLKMDEIAGKLESHSSRPDAIAAELVTTVQQLNSQIPESKRAERTV